MGRQRQPDDKSVNSRFGLQMETHFSHYSKVDDYNKEGKNDILVTSRIDIRERYSGGWGAAPGSRVQANSFEFSK